jgi:hypothetical protein
MPTYKVTLGNGTSSDETFDSNFQAINETHRPHAGSGTGIGIARIDRYEEDGAVVFVWSASTTRA